MINFVKQIWAGLNKKHVGNRTIPKTTPPYILTKYKEQKVNMIRVYNNKYSVKEDGSYSWRRNTQDGHGGMGEEHREEMTEIANQIAEEKIKAIVPQMAMAIYRQTIDDFLIGLRYDINTIVEISFNDGREIFTSSRAKKAVSDAIYKEIVKGLKDSIIKINF